MTHFFKTAFALTAVVTLVIVFGTVCIMAFAPEWYLFKTAMICFVILGICAAGYNLADNQSKR